MEVSIYLLYGMHLIIIICLSSTFTIISDLVANVIVTHAIIWVILDQTLLWTCQLGRRGWHSVISMGSKLILYNELGSLLELKVYYAWPFPCTTMFDESKLMLLLMIDKCLHRIMGYHWDNFVRLVTALRLIWCWLLEKSMNANLDYMGMWPTT